MTKTKLAERVSLVSGVPVGTTERVINFTIETILKTVQSGESVILPCFGKFFLASYMVTSTMLSEMEKLLFAIYPIIFFEWHLKQHRFCPHNFE